MRIHHVVSAVCALLLAGACTSAPRTEPVSTPLSGETCQSKRECMAEFDSSTVEVKPAARIGKAFRNWVFEITVADVEITSSVQYQDHDDTTKTLRPELGRFVMVPVRVTNVGKKPESFCVSCSTLIDTRGRSFTDGTIYTGLSQGFDEDLQPDQTEAGFMLFDVPKTVTKIRTVVVQPDPYMATENPPTNVRTP